MNFKKKGESIMEFWTERNFSELKGQIISVFKVDKETNEILITTNKEKYMLNHYQECCESVELKQIDGDIQDILDSPILLAEEISVKDDRLSTDIEDKLDLIQKSLIGSQELEQLSSYGSCTWTFYKLATIKGSITISWYGSSNGYYSEGVDLRVINEA